MPDREKVIKWLEDSLTNQGCGYMDGVGELYAVSGEDLHNAISLLDDFDTQLQYRDDHIAMYQAEIKRLEDLLKKQETVEHALEVLRKAGWTETQDVPFPAELLKEQEARELTIDEWREWKADSRRNPICMLWENDTSPIWILNPNDVHEPALLMGKLKLFTGRPTFEQCKAVKWDD